MEPVTAIVVLPDEHKEPNGEGREARFHAFVAMRDAREAKSDRRLVVGFRAEKKRREPTWRMTPFGLLVLVLVD